MQRNCTMGKKDINRLKVVLVAEQARRAPATVSKWYTNTLQPNFGILRQVADRHTWRSRSSLFFKITQLHCKILAYSR